MISVLELIEKTAMLKTGKLVNKIRLDERQVNKAIPILQKLGLDPSKREMSLLLMPCSHACRLTSSNEWACGSWMRRMSCQDWDNMHAMDCRYQPFMHLILLAIFVKYILITFYNLVYISGDQRNECDV